LVLRAAPQHALEVEFLDARLAAYEERCMDLEHWSIEWAVSAASADVVSGCLQSAVIAAGEQIIRAYAAGTEAKVEMLQSKLQSEIKRREEAEVEMAGLRAALAAEALHGTASSVKSALPSTPVLQQPQRAVQRPALVEDRADAAEARILELTAMLQSEEIKVRLLQEKLLLREQVNRRGSNRLTKPAVSAANVLVREAPRWQGLRHARCWCRASRSSRTA
jgi:hypothetical protein